MTDIFTDIQTFGYILDKTKLTGRGSELADFRLRKASADSEQVHFYVTLMLTPACKHAIGVEVYTIVVQ